MKSEQEIEAMRDRIADLVTSDTIESGSGAWNKLEAMEAGLDWTLGELEGVEQMVAEYEYEVERETDG